MYAFLFSMLAMFGFHLQPAQVPHPPAPAVTYAPVFHCQATICPQVTP